MLKEFRFYAVRAALALGCSFPAFYCGAQEYPVYKMNSIPALDGKLDDHAWRVIPEAEGFQVLGASACAEPLQNTPGQAEESLDNDGVYDLDNKTSFKAGWTKDALYIAGVCRQPNADKTAASASDNPDLWKNDCVEIHIAPKNGVKSQFIVNPAGGKWSSGCASNEWKLKSLATKDFWAFEAEIPFSVLGGAPSDKSKWRVNISRYISAPEQQYDTWSSKVVNFHDTANYGTFEFLKEISSPALKTQAEDSMNSKFKTAEKAALKKIASEEKVKRYFTVCTRNAAAKLYINGKAADWQTRKFSVRTTGGVTSAKLAGVYMVSPGENTVCVEAAASGPNPGVRIEAGEEVNDSNWKTGPAENRDWLKKNFNEKGWTQIALKEKTSDWEKNVNDPDYFYWGADPAAPKACFRQIIRGVEKADQNVKYSVNDWGKVLDGLGYHRAVVRVSEKAGGAVTRTNIGEGKINCKVVRAHIPWRRRDVNPEQKAILIFDSKSGKRIDNFEIINLNQEYLDIVFEPQTVPGDYEIYYLPYFECWKRLYYWEVSENYTKPYWTPDENWLSQASWLAGKSVGAKPRISDGNWQRLPKAELIEIQSRTEFDSFYPMELPATREETEEILAKNPKREYLVFPEDRNFPARMFEAIPLKWAKDGAFKDFKGEAQPGEYYCFQLGVFAARKDIKNLSLTFSDFKNEKGDIIPAKEFHCVNLGGTDCYGKPLTKTFSVRQGNVRPLWTGFQIPENASGVYSGTATVKPEGMEPETVKISVAVSGPVIADKGDNEPWRHSRLRWLDSTLGISDDEIVPPYTPLKVSGGEIECLNKKIVFGVAGMPEKIISNGKNVISGPVKFEALSNGAAGSPWRQSAPDKIVLEKAAKVVRESFAENDSFSLVTKTTVEEEGLIRFDISVNAKNNIASADTIKVEIPYSAEASKYISGAPQFSKWGGWPGGLRPSLCQWGMENNVKLWIGDYDAGMQANFSGKTSGSVKDANGGCVFTAGTGKISIGKDHPALFSFRLFVTPFKPVDYKKHWLTRTGYYPRDNWANITHVHHATPGNLWINYPFLNTDELAGIQKKMTDKGGLGVQLYYTTRELTDRVTEMWALRSLGDEIFGADVYAYPQGTAAKTDGQPWLREHLINGFSMAWRTPMKPGVTDMAIGNRMSRWQNYYIEGLNWLARNNCIVSLYLDGIGYDREIMKRAAVSLAKANPDYRIEIHQGCSYNGDIPNSPMNDYMEFLPFATRLWYGEQFNYNRPPDYWLVEISGIPFGLTNEMLDNTKTVNPWRGMIYGMNARTNPEFVGSIYKLQDDFGIIDSEMLGYWDSKCPVKTGREDIPATVYKKKDKALVCLASWADKNENVKLSIDWKALGLDPAKCRAFAPEMKNLQAAHDVDLKKPLVVEKAKGTMFIVEKI